MIPVMVNWPLFFFVRANGTKATDRSCISILAVNDAISRSKSIAQAIFMACEIQIH